MCALFVHALPCLFYVNFVCGRELDTRYTNVGIQCNSDRTVRSDLTIVVEVPVDQTMMENTNESPVSYQSATYNTEGVM